MGLYTASLEICKNRKAQRDEARDQVLRLRADLYRMTGQRDELLDQGDELRKRNEALEAENENLAAWTDATLAVYCDMDDAEDAALEELAEVKGENALLECAIRESNYWRLDALDVAEMTEDAESAALEELAEVGGLLGTGMAGRVRELGRTLDAEVTENERLRGLLARTIEPLRVLGDPELGDEVSAALGEEE